MGPGGAPVNVNPSSATNATSSAAAASNTSKVFNFGPPAFASRVPTWAIVAGVLVVGAFLWHLSKKR